MNDLHYIFGYGSLVNLEDLKQYTQSNLIPSYKHISVRGFKRNWSVAMNNLIDLPNYKYYLDEDGVRVDKYIAFLNIEKAADSVVNGILFEIDKAKFPELDARERNYNRVNITDYFPNEKGCAIWSYLGKKESQKRYFDGVKTNKVVIQQGYYDKVIHAFQSVSDEFLEEFLQNTDFGQIPKMRLRRIDTSF